MRAAIYKGVSLLASSVLSRATSSLAHLAGISAGADEWCLIFKFVQACCSGAARCTSAFLAVNGRMKVMAVTVGGGPGGSHDCPERMSKVEVVSGSNQTNSLHTTSSRRRARFWYYDR